MPGTKTEPTESQQKADGGGRYATIIFNNDSNSFEDVIEILMIATACTFEEARIETWEAHTYGQASVHFASEAECLRVASMISSIGVRTEVRKEWEN